MSIIQHCVEKLITYDRPYRYVQSTIDNGQHGQHGSHLYGNMVMLDTIAKTND